MVNKSLTFTVKQARMYSGLTIRKSAEFLKVSIATIERWESGQTKIPFSKIRDMADLYGVPIENFKI